MGQSLPSIHNHVFIAITTKNPCQSSRGRGSNGERQDISYQLMLANRAAPCSLDRDPKK